jgi:ribosome modulation factor
MGDPETEQAVETLMDAKSAFSRGYRMAKQGKSMQDIPSQIRNNPQLRQPFQDGWMQALTESAQSTQHKTNWKLRIIWIIFSILGGLEIAWQLSERVNQDRAEQKLSTFSTYSQSQIYAKLNPNQNFDKTQVKYEL